MNCNVPVGRIYLLKVHEHAADHLNSSAHRIYRDGEAPSQVKSSSSTSTLFWDTSGTITSLPVVKMGKVTQIRRSITDLITGKHLPFSLIESPLWKEFLASLEPDNTKHVPLAGNTARQWIGGPILVLLQTCVRRITHGHQILAIPSGVFDRLCHHGPLISRLI